MPEQMEFMRTYDESVVNNFIGESEKHDWSWLLNPDAESYRRVSGMLDMYYNLYKAYDPTLMTIEQVMMAMRPDEPMLCIHPFMFSVIRSLYQNNKVPNDFDLFKSTLLLTLKVFKEDYFDKLKTKAIELSEKNSMDEAADLIPEIERLEYMVDSVKDPSFAVIVAGNMERNMNSNMKAYFVTGTDGKSSRIEIRSRKAKTEEE